MGRQQLRCGCCRTQKNRNVNRKASGVALNYGLAGSIQVGSNKHVIKNEDHYSR